MTKKILSLIITLALLASAGAAYAAASPEPSDKTIKREIKIGRKSAAEIEKHVPRVLNPSVEAKLSMIASRLIPYMQRDLDYEVRILEMEQPNAFSLPGGMTYITTGMLDFLKSEDEIAAVLCHEFVHADRAHGIVQARRNSRLNLLTLAGLIAATQVGEGGAGIAAMAGGIQTAMMNTYSIDLEKEADAMGIDVLYRAGYNPAAMLTMMERMNVERLKRAQYELGIYQTHPEADERVEAALKYLREKGIDIQRRDVVQKLRVKVDEEGGRVVLRIDETEFLSAPAGGEARALLDKTAKRLDETLELELLPYDIRVSELGGERSLVIGRETILREDELLPGMPELPVLRDRVMEAVNLARRGGILTDYYE